MENKVVPVEPTEENLGAMASMLDSSTGVGTLKERARLIFYALKATLAAAPAESAGEQPPLCEGDPCYENPSTRSTLPNPPFTNCKFEHCDLPGQCRSEGKCHHPTSAADESVSKNKHIPTDKCGYDRTQSVSEGCYVCLCGWSDENGYAAEAAELKLARIAERGK